MTIKDATGTRPLTVDVWFPLKTGFAGEPHDYTLVPGTYYRSPAALSAKVTDIAGDGPFPLVVYSHGSGGLRYIASYYTEAIASYGYVVIAPDHTGNTAVERLTGSSTDQATTAFNRPRDVSFVLDAILSADNPDVGTFASSIDPLKIAVTGHSFGGFTALAMASGYSNSLGSVKPDPRVRAIVALAPAVGTGNDLLLSDANLAAIRVPTMVMVGTSDKTTPVEPNVTRLFKLGGASPLYELQLKAAQHQSFTDICDYEKFLPTLSGVPPVIIQTIASFAVEGCAPTDMPIERAKSLTDTFAIRFLESVFRNGPAISNASVTGVDDVLFDSK